MEDDSQSHHLILEDIPGVSASRPFSIDSVIHNNSISQTKEEELEQDTEVDNMGLLNLSITLELHIKYLEQFVVRDRELLLLED